MQNDSTLLKTTIEEEGMDSQAVAVWEMRVMSRAGTSACGMGFSSSCYGCLEFKSIWRKTLIWRCFITERRTDVVYARMTCWRCSLFLSLLRSTHGAFR